MRRRLIVAFLALAIGIIALYGIPRIFTASELVHDSEAKHAGRSATFVAAAIGEREQRMPVDEAFLVSLLSTGESVEYRSADGTTVTAGPRRQADAIVGTALAPNGGTVSFARSGEIVGQRVAAVVRPVIVIGALLLVVATVAAVLLARALSRPFVKLVDTIREIGRGNADPPREPLGVPEARAIDAALRDSAQELAKRLRREHEFAANASHQLRTPITALRLELEDLSLWPETPPAVREQLDHAVHEIDRLADAISQLLELARGKEPGGGGFQPLEGMIRSAAGRWSTQGEASGRRIVVTIDDALGDAPATTSQILDVLLHNALTHGRGEVTVSSTRRAEYVTVRVSDEGERPSGNAIFQRRPAQRSATSGEGIGLALSAELAESIGGHLLLDSAEQTTFSLILPARG